LDRITEALGITVAGVTAATGVSDDSLRLSELVIFPANDAVLVWDNSDGIESGNDWQENRNSRKLQLSNFSFMGIGFQPE
jgi:hypothetical protein